MTLFRLRLPRLALFIFAATLFFSATALADEFRVMEYQEDYPPVFFREKHVPKGIVPDILTAIGDMTGDRFVYVKAPFQRLQLMFENGEIDIEPSVNPVWRDSAKVKGTYTIPYGESVNVFLFPDEKSAIKDVSRDNLIGKLFGTVRGYSYLDLQPALDEGTIHAVFCQDEEKLMELMAQHRIDATVILKPFAQYQMKQHAEFRSLAFGRQFSRLDIMMRFQPSKAGAVERFNKAIRNLKDSGEIERIYDRYR